jgi:hypothetical protein
VLHTPDPDFAPEDRDEVEITDLDTPSKSGKVPKGLVKQRYQYQSQSFKEWYILPNMQMT